MPYAPYTMYDVKQAFKARLQHCKLSRGFFLSLLVVSNLINSPFPPIVVNEVYSTKSKKNAWTVVYRYCKNPVIAVYSRAFLPAPLSWYIVSKCAQMTNLQKIFDQMSRLSFAKLTTLIKYSDSSK